MQGNKELQDRMRDKFYRNLFSKDANYNSVMMTKQKYDSVIEDVKRIKVSKKKESSRDYRIIERYDTLTVEGCEKLIEPMTDAGQSVKMFVHADELFDVLYFAHLSINHGGRDKMIKKLNTTYKNVTQAQIKLLLDSCEVCQRKQKGDGRGTVVKDSGCQSSGTSSREEEKKNDPLPLEPTVVIKEEPVDYDPTPSTTTSITNEEFILPHQENTWTPPVNVPPEPVVEPQFTLSVAHLASPNYPETSVGEQVRKKRKIETVAAALVPSTVLEVRPQSPVYSFGESSNPDSSKDQFDMFGEYVAAKLRSLDRTSCAFAQKAIGDVIFEAEIGKYLNGESKECSS